MNIDWHLQLRGPRQQHVVAPDTGIKQRLIHILVQEIVCDLDDAANEAVLLIHWTGTLAVLYPLPSSEEAGQTNSK